MNAPPAKAVGFSPTPKRSRHLTSPPDVYWAGPGHPLGWVPGTPVYESALAAVRALEYVTHPCDLRALRAAVRAQRSALLLLDLGGSPDHLATQIDGSDDAGVPPHAWPEGWELIYSLCVDRVLLDAHVLPTLPDVDRARLSFHGPRNAFTIAVGASPAAIVMPYTTCVYEHCRNDGRYYEGGVAHECPARDCVMGRLYGWDWRPPTRWEFCEAIGEQGRSAWVPVPADAPRTEPCEVGTEAVPLAHRFHRDGRP